MIEARMSEVNASDGNSTILLKVLAYANLPSKYTYMYIFSVVVS